MDRHIPACMKYKKQRDIRKWMHEEEKKRKIIIKYEKRSQIMWNPRSTVRPLNGM